MVTTVTQTTTLLTSVEFDEMVGEDDRLELWRGVVVEMSPVKPIHNKVGFRLAATLSYQALQTEVGEFWPPDAGFTIERGPDTVVSPDLTFVPADVARRLNDDKPGFPLFVPPLVVEIKSPSDSERQIAAKLALYFEAGVAEVWWLRPRQKTLTRYWADRDPVVLGPGDTLTDVDVLPGFSVLIDDLFPADEPSQVAQRGAD